MRRAFRLTLYTEYLYLRMRVINTILDVITFIEPQPASAVPLAGENIKITVAVEIDHVGTGDHLDT